MVEFVVSHDDDIYVKATPRKTFNNQHLVSTSGLIGASKEINHELYSALNKHAFGSASRVMAIIPDFDFRSLIRFMKSLKECQIASLDSRDSGPQLVAELYVVDTNNLDGARFGAWLKCRKTNTVRMAFEVSEVPDGDGGHLLSRLIHTQRSMPEVREMVEAFLVWSAAQ
ncbi:hypothetical protein LTR36_000272 [Oleoguttula mirabilis]|uniref:Uncharacterized protein n=1 Tax=Oleoguttula mirabilis TaxID=1507867 RepID=A0AAV9JY30_9PEZI|nr:hypothetical protein LTR36_000272 [Oleoguttula mirabilis]